MRHADTEYRQGWDHRFKGTMRPHPGSGRTTSRPPLQPAPGLPMTRKYRCIKNLYVPIVPFPKLSHPLVPLSPCRPRPVSRSSPSCPLPRPPPPPFPLSHLPTFPLHPPGLACAPVSSILHGPARWMGVSGSCSVAGGLHRHVSGVPPTCGLTQVSPLRMHNPKQSEGMYGE